jgi:hypothetical protein
MAPSPQRGQWGWISTHRGGCGWSHPLTPLHVCAEEKLTTLAHLTPVGGGGWLHPHKGAGLEPTLSAGVEPPSASLCEGGSGVEFHPLFFCFPRLLNKNGNAVA